MLRRLDWAIGWLERLARIWLVLMVVVVLVFTFGQVLDRYLVSTGFDGFDQLARLGLVWATFIGIALAFRDRRTIRIELFEERLPPWLKRAPAAFTRSPSHLCMPGPTLTMSSKQQHWCAKAVLSKCRSAMRSRRWRSSSGVATPLWWTPIYRRYCAAM